MDKKVISDLKKYAWVGQIEISTVVTIILGLLLGYFLDYCLETNYWIIVCIIVFFLIACANFFYHIYKIGKRQ